MTANYTDTGIDLEIHETATLDSLFWLRERVQSHIDALTQQTSPVQVVENEPEWSEWFNWSGGENPVRGCKVKTSHISGVVDEDWANASWWDHKPKSDPFSMGNITSYRVLLSSIPDGYSLMYGILVEDPWEGGWQA